ncbi:ribonuclease domain-containing protein [Streptomyces sp. NPDC091280]|uniref:ribonuclease domain-containing protein n=1 Tax=Streptomyces sp. NPDC091280 TaxID=3365984 RepID=UPI00382C4C3C
MLLALVGGAVAEPSGAFAQAPPGQTNHGFQNPPAGSGISQADWNEILRAAGFWSNVNIDAYPNWGVGHLEVEPGRGWPGQAGGNRWFDFWDSNAHANRYIYYGGRFNDYQGLVSNIERANGASSSQAHSTQGSNVSPYVEYDIDEYTSTGVRRNARRIVRNPNTGNVYATTDHYNSFNLVGKF